MKIPKILHTISQKLHTHNAKAILVGGSVRDHFLGLSIKDYDLEVYGLKRMESLEAILQKFGKVKLVGKSFGVLKFVHQGQEYDFAFPRREKKIGAGHKGFEVVSDGFMTFQEAARRRDFTINAMGYVIEENRFLDPYGGKSDMQQSLLRHIDDRTFVEDPLRVYRGVQFCARFTYDMAEETKILCQSMAQRGDLLELPKERVFDELKKLLLKAQKPSLGVILLKSLELKQGFFPFETLEETLWHNTLKSVDRMVSFCKGSEREDLILMLSALFLYIPARESSLLALTEELKLIEAVQRLTAYYDLPVKLFDLNASDGEIRKLSTKVSIQKLSYLALASGSSPEKVMWLESRAQRVGVLEQAPEQLLQGRDLIDLGLKPSHLFSIILAEVYTKQLEGEIESKKAALDYVSINYKDKE
ncbi:MAG: hypothetical protein K0U47_00850 [Epsilonproteobacteria bacterium]|nr:hypothetical protein [Campylobacterota bacterium]